MSSIYKGTTEFTKVYKGSDEISKIYKGETLIFQNTIPNALISYYRLNENSGNIVTDNIAGRNLTLYNNPTWATGKNGYCVLFDASNEAGSGSTSMFNFERTDAFSVSFWHKRVSGVYSMISIGKETVPDATPRRGWSVYLYQNRPYFYLVSDFGASNGVFKYATGTATCSTTTFNHLVFTYDGSSSANGIRIYNNGSNMTLTTTGVVTITTTTKTNELFVIGRTPAGSSPTCYLDEIGIWNYALSQTEVTALYNNGTGVFY